MIPNANEDTSFCAAAAGALELGDTRAACMTESAIVVASVAITAVVLGGRVDAIRLHWRKRGDTASYFTGDISRDANEFSRVAGTMAQELVTGRKSGFDYTFNYFLNGQSQTFRDGYLTEMKATDTVIEHWPAIERLATALLASKGKRSFSTVDIRPMISPGYATPITTRADIPDEIIDVWNARLRKVDAEWRKS
jgi:hypothetical protein